MEILLRMKDVFSEKQNTLFRNHLHFFNLRKLSLYICLSFHPCATCALMTVRSSVRLELLVYLQCMILLFASVWQVNEMTARYFLKEIKSKLHAKYYLSDSDYI